MWHWVSPVCQTPCQILYKQGKQGTERPGHLGKAAWQMLCVATEWGMSQTQPSSPRGTQSLWGTLWWKLWTLSPGIAHTRKSEWNTWWVHRAPPFPKRPLQLKKCYSDFHQWRASAEVSPTERGRCVSGLKPSLPEVCMAPGLTPPSVCNTPILRSQTPSCRLPTLWQLGLASDQNSSGPTLLKQWKHFLTHINKQTFTEN